MDPEKVEIKVEDEIGIFVKEEETFVEVPVINLGYDENASINFDDPLLEPNPEPEKELLVYTTRVDEIWRKKCKRIKIFLYRIEEESKPVFTGKYKKKKKRKNLVKYNRFVQHLQYYNETIADYNKRKEEVAYNKYIGTEQYKQSLIAKVFHNTQQRIPTITVDDKSDSTDTAVETLSLLSSIDTDDEVDTAKREDSSHRNVKKIESANQIKSNYYYVVVMHKLRSLLCDVYYASKEGIPKEFYQIDFHRVDSIFSPYVRKIFINNCCWYKRDERIKQALPDFSTILQAFMRKSHACDLNKCTCCCRKKRTGRKPLEIQTNTHNTKDVIQVRNHFQNRWHQRLLKQPVQQNENSIINAALTYTPKRKISKKYSRDSDHDQYLNLKIGADEVLGYHIERNGSINTMIKVIVTPDTSLVTNYFKDMLGTQLFQNVTEEICCLDKYKRYILKLLKLGMLSIAKFLTKCSKIAVNKCVRCKALEPQTSTSDKKIIQIYLPKYPKHGKSYSNIKMRYCISVLNKNLIQTSEPESNHTKKSNYKVMPSSNLQKQPKIKKSCSSAVCSNKIKYCNISPSSIDLDVDNLRLIIEPGGIVKFQTKTIPEKISTENLKILRDIIRYSNKKIESLDLNLTKKINVRNLFTKKNTKTVVAATTSQQTQTNNSNTKGTSFNGKKSLDNDMQNKINKNRPHSVNLNSKNIFKPCGLDSYTEKYGKNVYLSFKDINVQKRKQYLNSYEFITNAGTDVWTHVKMLEHYKNSKSSLIHNVNTYNHTKQNNKRKTTEKGSSPPPKQKRTDNSEGNVTPDNVAAPSTSGTILRNVLEPPLVQPDIRNSGTILQNAFMPPLVQPDTQNTLVSNAAITKLPNNVTVIPIGQLPQDLVRSLYNQYAFLPLKTPEHNSVPIQIPGPINLTELPIVSTDNVSLLPATVHMPSNVSNVPINVEKFDNNEDDDGDCILGV